MSRCHIRPPPKPRRAAGPWTPSASTPRPAESATAGVRRRERTDALARLVARPKLKRLQRESQGSLLDPFGDSSIETIEGIWTFRRQNKREVSKSEPLQMPMLFGMFIPKKTFLACGFGLLRGVPVDGPPLFASCSRDASPLF